jgi:hypothetical protein
MKNPNSPFRVMLRVSGYCGLISMVVACYLFVTSHTNTQYMLAAVVLVLMLLLSIAIGFYVGMTAYYHREQLEIEDRQRALVEHYPARATFDRKIDAMDRSVSKLYKKDGRYA